VPASWDTERLLLDPYSTLGNGSSDMFARMRLDNSAATPPVFSIDKPVVARFAVLRTPLLSYDELQELGDGLEAAAVWAAHGDSIELAAALQRDEARLRALLGARIQQPAVREALYLASPALEASLDEWSRDPKGRRGQKVERALVRYLYRMASRPTPFGLFAGCSVVAVGQQTRLRLGPRGDYRRYIRLDGDCLAAVCEGMSRDPLLRAELRYRPNSSIYQAGGSLRLVESCVVEGNRSYYLTEVAESPYLAATLAQAQDGARLGELAESLVTRDPRPDLSEASAFLDELVDSQLLVSDLTPAITGPEALQALVTRLARPEVGQGQPVVAVLTQVRDELAGLNQKTLGADPACYRAITQELQAVCGGQSFSNVFQVDLRKPVADSAIGKSVLAEVCRGTELLWRIGASKPRHENALTRFVDDFVARYADQEVPLCEVLDPESGIGFATVRSPPAGESPLLAGLALPAGGEAAGELLGRREQHLLARLGEALRRGAPALELGPGDLEHLTSARRLPMPDSFAVLATVLATGEQGLAEDNFRVHVLSASGPSGVAWLGRFCHSDERLAELVRGHQREEEALRPAAIYAEVVHLPEGHLGGLLRRPLLRQYEIPFLGHSGAPLPMQIPVSDLLVSVQHGRVVLRSARHRREVIPRLTTAHNFGSPSSLSMYHFLCALQGQGVAGGIEFSWGALATAPYLPRVVSGRVILSLARWRLGAAQLAAIGKSEGAARFAAMKELQAELGLPRLVALVDGDNRLPVDLDNVLSVESAGQLLKGRTTAVLSECLLDPAELCAAGPEGRFVHELIVPFVRSQPPTMAEPPRPAPPACPPAPLVRRFLPGSEWLYAKLYSGIATTDRILTETIAPVVRSALSSGAASGWFFIRYGDPEWHLRLRLHGQPVRLLAEVLPALHAAVAPLAALGRLWRCQLDTYEPEIERYGGPMGIRLAEQIFQADSEAALAVLGSLPGAQGADARWRLVCYGIDRLLSDLGLDLLGKREVVQRQRAGLGKEFAADARLVRQLGERYRVQRRFLVPLLAGEVEADPAHPLAASLAPFSRRTQQLAPIVVELRHREQQGQLSASILTLAGSFAHMHANRLLRSAARAHELVLYDFLSRLYEEQLVRARPEASQPA